MSPAAKAHAWDRGVRELRAELAAAVVAVARYSRPAPHPLAVILPASVLVLAGLVLLTPGAADR